MLLLIGLLESAVRRVVARRGDRTQWLRVRSVCRLLAAIPLTQLLQALALVKAMTQRQVYWRGDTIEIRGPYDIRTVARQSASAVAPSIEDKTSL